MKMIRRAAVSSFVAIALTVAVAAPADAAGALATPATALVFVSASSTSATTVDVCASGYTDDAPEVTGVWTLTIGGAGTGGPIAKAVPVIGTTFPSNCYPINTGTIASFTATLTYAGVGVDVVAACVIVAVRAGFLSVESACTNTTTPALTELT